MQIVPRAVTPAANINNLNAALQDVETFSPFDFLEGGHAREDSASVSDRPVKTLADLYGHAILANEQAILACDEFSEIFDTRGENATVAIFRKLSGAEFALSCQLTRARLASGLPLAQFPWWPCSWLYQTSPDRIARDTLAHLLTPLAATRIALAAESHVQAKYQRIAGTAGDSVVRTLARELSVEKYRHVQWLVDSLSAA